MKFFKLCRISLLALIVLLITIPMCLAAKPVNYDDLTVLGVPYNAQKSDIINSLGTPNREGVLTRSMNAAYYITYGGVTFNLDSKGDTARISSIGISNRDAITVRGVAVGDPKSKIINSYGDSYQIVNNGNKKEYRYLWGKANSDDAHGISFQCNEEIIYGIIIWP